MPANLSSTVLMASADEERPDDLGRTLREGGYVREDDSLGADAVRAAEQSPDVRRMEQAVRDTALRKDEFLVTVAHELRSSLAAIGYAAHALHSGGHAAAEVVRATGVIDRQVRLMTILIDDLRDLSRISRNCLELCLERVELASVISAAVETSRPVIAEHGHDLSVTLPPNPVLLDVDPARLIQVFSNLLNNAAKYTGPGGCIDVRAELHRSDVVVTVQDTGIGIPASQLMAVFEMFAQVDSTPSRSQGGLGVGLCLVKRLVEMHGGSVEARSDGPGKGSNFVVRLPAFQGLAPGTGDDTDSVGPLTCASSSCRTADTLQGAWRC